MGGALPASAKMDAIYRYQRFIYDVTRRHYLLGRDSLIDDLNPPRGASVLEVGCGTGRNLLQLLQRYPDLHAYGFDISALMLETAKASIDKSGHRHRVHLHQVDACGAEGLPRFGQKPYDRIYFSYVLSMLPDWKRAIVNAMAALAPGGEIHIVDFGQSNALPGIFRALLFRWLKHFHVTPVGDCGTALRLLCEGTDFQAQAWQSHRSYTLRAVIRRDAGANAYQSSFATLS